MTQRELHRALSRATGESIGIIRRFGFSLVEPGASPLDAEATDLPPQIVDWDAVEAERVALAILA
jgi:hypothetical protein